MNELRKRFAEEVLSRFDLEKFAEKENHEVLNDIGKRYVRIFLNDPDVKEKYAEEASLREQALLHCYHAGIIVALYEITEEGYVPSEKTFAVLTNMDTLFFSSIMYSRWQPKKRYAKYQTDPMAKSLYRLLCHIVKEQGLSLADPEVFAEVLLLLFLAGAAADLPAMEDPKMDLNGIE